MVRPHRSAAPLVVGFLLAVAVILLWPDRANAAEPELLPLVPGVVGLVGEVTDGLVDTVEQTTGSTGLTPVVTTVTTTVDTLIEPMTTTVDQLVTPLAPPVTELLLGEGSEGVEAPPVVDAPSPTGADTVSGPTPAPFEPDPTSPQHPPQHPGQPSRAPSSGDTAASPSPVVQPASEGTADRHDGDLTGPPGTDLSPPPRPDLDLGLPMAGIPPVPSPASSLIDSGGGSSPGFHAVVSSARAAISGAGWTVTSTGPPEVSPPLAEILDRPG